MSVVNRNEIVKNVGGAGRTQAFGADVVFNGARNTGQGFYRFPGGNHSVNFCSLGQGVFFIQRHIGADLLFHFVNAVIYRFRQLNRADLFILQLFMQFMNGALV